MANPNLRPCDYEYFDVVLDGPPGNKSGRFVEVESPEGESISVGTWIDRGDGTWALRIAPAQEPPPVRHVGDSGGSK